MLKNLNSLDLSILSIYRPLLQDDDLLLKRITTSEMYAMTCILRSLGYPVTFELLRAHQYKLMLSESK